jgi:hypothetical protein
MAINSPADYLAAKKQRLIIQKTASITAVANTQFQNFHQAGNPGAGTLAGTSTTTGVVPTDATAGCPIINAFDGGAKGYLTNLEAWAPVAMNLMIYDCLWKAGAYAFNANTSGQSPTSYASRVPGGTDFTGLELWLEAVTAFTGNLSCAITYTDQDGNTGASTGTVGTGAALIVGRMFNMPLASGDTGLQGVTGVVGSVASAGTFNVLVLRPLAKVRIPAANFLQKLNLYDLGCPEVFADSALMALPTPDSTATSTPWVMLEISNK